jgi:hypothetical protein
MERRRHPCHSAGMAKTTCRVVLQDDMTYAVEMDVGRSVRTVRGFSSQDDARAWVARANLQEMQPGPSGIDRAELEKRGLAKPRDDRSS